MDARTVGERIRDRRKEIGMSQEELCAKAGYTEKASISKIEKGQRRIPIDRLPAIASALSCSVAYLLGYRIDPEAEEDDEKEGFNRRYFPVLGEIACGQPIVANEEYGTIISTEANIKADFCLRAKGDSMINAGIQSGDIIFIKKTDQVENGNIAAVVIGEEATLKRINYNPKAGILILSAENPKYEPIYVFKEDLASVTILGQAVALQRKL